MNTKEFSSKIFTKVKLIYTWTLLNSKDVQLDLKESVSVLESVFISVFKEYSYILFVRKGLKLEANLIC